MSPSLKLPVGNLLTLVADHGIRGQIHALRKSNIIFLNRSNQNLERGLMLRLFHSLLINPVVYLIFFHNISSETFHPPPQE